LPEELDTPDLPECAQHIWAWYYQLAAGRQCGMSINPLAWPQIAAWAALNRIQLREWELQAIMGIDGAYLSNFHDSQEKPKTK